MITQCDIYMLMIVSTLSRLSKGCYSVSWRLISYNTVSNRAVMYNIYIIGRLEVRYLGVVLIWFRCTLSDYGQTVARSGTNTFRAYKSYQCDICDSDSLESRTYKYKKRNVARLLLLININVLQLVDTTTTTAIVHLHFNISNTNIF